MLLFLPLILLASNNKSQIIQEAMKLTNTNTLSGSNQAIQLWEEALLLFPDDDNLNKHESTNAFDNNSTVYTTEKKLVFNEKLPPNVLFLSQLMYGAALVRVGRDRDAVRVYRYMLDSNNFNVTSPNSMEVIGGYGRSLQRCMCYKQAADHYREYLFSFISHLSSITDPNLIIRIFNESLILAEASAACYLRCCDEDYVGEVKFMMENTLHVIKTFAMERNDISLEIQCDAIVTSKFHGMLGALKWSLMLLKKSKCDDDYNDSVEIKGIHDHLIRAKQCNSLHFDWLLRVFEQYDFRPTTGESDDSDNSAFALNLNRYTLRQLAESNNSPFDYPDFLLFDNKVMLHELLVKFKDSRCFWPEGYILLDELEKLKIQTIDRGGDDLYILKDPTGYGSHGNRILSASELMDIDKHSGFDHNQRYLCQKVLTDPLLINGKRFSIRSYVILFPRISLDGKVDDHFDVFICRDGLVKLADEDDVNFNKEDISTLRDIILTNSGRKDHTFGNQSNFMVLREKMAMDETSYSQFWANMKSVVDATIRSLLHDPALSRTKLLPLPKILGYDILVDEKVHPWLIEINRFPGLEPRNFIDEQVKRKVLESTWELFMNKSHNNARKNVTMVEKSHLFLDFVGTY